MKHVPRPYSPLELMRSEWGKRIFAQRNALGLTQQQLADLATTTQGTIARIERGSCGMSDDLKIRMAAALGMDFNDLFRGDLSAAA